MILEFMKVLHFAGLIGGVSGATVLALLFKKALSESALLESVFKISRSTMNIVWTSIAALAVSGISLSILGSYFPSDGLVFTFKLILSVAILFLTGYIEFGVYRKVKAMGTKQSVKAVFNLCKTNCYLSWLVATLWYIVIFLSVYSVK